MKYITIASESHNHKISFCLLTCFLISLPFDIFYSEVFLWTYAIHTLIQLRKFKRNLFFNKNIILVSLPFLVGVLSASYSRDYTEAMNISTRQVSLFLLPILFKLNDFDLLKYKEDLLKIFAFTCTLTVAYLYWDAIHTIIYFHMPLRSLFSLAFMNHNFAFRIGIHATYLSMYVAFSIIIFLYLVLKTSNRNLLFFYLLSAVFLTLSLLQLSSRAVLIALFLIITTVLPFFISGKWLKIFLFCAMISCLAGAYLIIHFDVYRVRYISEFQEDLKGSPEMIEYNESRMARWKATLDLVKQSPIIGYGSGSEKKLLKEMYFTRHFYISFINEFNSHSEYLSFLLKAGIIGLIIYIYVLVKGFIIACKKRDLLFCSFMIIIIIVSVSENVLDLNKGIFFYAFFFSLFLSEKKIDYLKVDKAT